MDNKSKLSLGQWNIHQCRMNWLQTRAQNSSRERGALMETWAANTDMKIKEVLLVFYIKNKNIKIAEAKYKFYNLLNTLLWGQLFHWSWSHHFIPCLQKGSWWHCLYSNPFRCWELESLTRMLILPLWILHCGCCERSRRESGRSLKKSRGHGARVVRRREEREREEGEKRTKKEWVKTKFRGEDKGIDVICSENLKVIYTLYDSSWSVLSRRYHRAHFSEGEILAPTTNNWDLSFDSIATVALFPKLDE